MKPIMIGIAVSLVTAACSGHSSPTAPAASFTVVRVLDGDSLVVAGNGTETEVRLLGINTPERGECFEAEARLRTAELAATAVRLDGQDEDRFGRLLAYAYTESGALINRRLVDEGLALALSTDHPLRTAFKEAEAEAFSRRVGRWQTDACGPAAEVAVRIEGLTFDAPGNDAENSNGEWVDLINAGPGTAALGGWGLQDESSIHRFAFPTGLSLGPEARVRVFSGCGVPSDEELYWGECDGDAVWNNGGDTAYLLDPSGNVVDRFSY